MSLYVVIEIDIGGEVIFGVVPVRKMWANNGRDYGCKLTSSPISAFMTTYNPMALFPLLGSRG